MALGPITPVPGRGLSMGGGAEARPGLRNSGRATPRRKRAPCRALDDAVKRLRAVNLRPLNAADPLAKNVRFRLAQAIADRARFEPENDPVRLASEREALGMLDASLNVTRLRLRPAVPGRAGQPPPALRPGADGDRGGREDLAPAPGRRVLEAKIAAMTGRELAEARSLVDPRRWSTT